ncbi:MAG: PfkB family carbohydrate kinase, partial [Sphingomonadaceae bacterium]
VVTPNAPELAALTGRAVDSAADALAAGRALAARGAAVLVKGGHLPGDPVVDTLLLPDGGEVRFTAPRVATRHTHGTGCALASALATGLAAGLPLAEAAHQAHAFVAAAIAHAPGLGAGHGPLGHVAAGRLLRLEQS